jgi:hypothetical protein
MTQPILSPENAVWAADQFIDYYAQFQRIDEYLRFIKESRLQNETPSLFGIDDEIFSDFSIHPQDMKFSIHTVDTSPKPKSKYCQSLYRDIMEHTTSAAIEEAIPGRTIKWIITEDNTNTVVGVVRFGSPTINSKPRNLYFEETVGLKRLNAEFVMGFNIIPVQPFGFNYLGGKLMCLLAASNRLKREFDEKYGTDLKYFETTSLYGKTKGGSMYDGLKPFVRYIGNTESVFLPLFHDDYFKKMFWWFNDNANEGERLVSADKSSKKIKIQQKMISIIKRSLKDPMKLAQFNGEIERAKGLTEQKRTYLGKFGYEPEDAIEWWKKKATKRYENLVSDGRLRTELEIWKPGANIDIIR